MDRASLIFCGGALVACLLIAAIAFPFSAMTKAQATSAKSVAAAEDLGEMDLGGFGKVSVLDLVSYYIENPPEPEAAGAAPRKVRFEGC